MKGNDKVVKLKSRRTINIGVVIFIFILIYIGVSLYFYFTKSHLSIYEVQDAALAQDNVVTGVIIRDETAVTTDTAGYINYFYQNGSRVSKNTYLYTVDETKSIYDQISNTETTERIDESDAEYIRNLINNFRKSFNQQDYTTVSAIQTELTTSMQELTQTGLTELVDGILSTTDSPDTFHVVKSKQSGIVSYDIDSLSGLKLSDVNSETFNIENYTPPKIRTSNVAESNGQIMNIIDDGTWYIVCKLKDTQYTAVKDMTSLDILIRDDSFKITVPLEIMKIDSEYYAKFTLDKYMIRYFDKRFLEVELLWQVSNGFKIPSTAVTEKEFFLVPNEFFMYGGDSANKGLTVETIDEKTNEVKYTFIESTIYYDDGVYSYIDTEQFKLGDVLFSVDSEYYTLNIQETLQGVYNVNKGYAVFRRIELLYQNDDYCIVQKDTQYGIALYDHIALDAQTAVDSKIIY